MTLKEINHTFTNPELSYTAQPNYQPYIKLLFFFRKLPSVSDEHFHRHWETVHADLTVSVKEFGGVGVRRYTQMHQTADMKEKVTASGATLLDYDGCSEIWVRTWDDWKRFANSEGYKSALHPDCGNFMDAASITVFAGQENVIYGKAMDIDNDGKGNGKDGIVTA